MEYEILNLYQKIIYVFVNIQAIIGVIGIVGNILAFCVFYRKPLRKLTYSFYWRVIAFTDSLKLTHTFRHWANFVYGFNIDLQSSFFCRINEYQPYVFGTISEWLLILISLDRLIVIAYPNQIHILQKRWFQKLLVLIVVIYSLLIHIDLPLNYRLVETVNSTNTSEITFSCRLPIGIQQRFSYIIFINIILANVLINNVLNLKLILFIKSSRLKTNQNVILRRSTIRDRKFAISSIVLNIASILVKIPFVVGRLASKYYHVNEEINQMIFMVTITILIIDNCDLFFVNMFVNSIFYQEFRKMIKLK